MRITGTALIGLGTVLGACASKGPGSGATQAELPRPPKRDLAAAARLADEGNALFKAKKTDEAIEKYRAALTEYPDFGAVWTNLGIAMLEKRDSFNAAKAFERANQLDPRDPRPLENLGFVFMELGRFETAMSQYEEALKINPASVTALRGAVEAAFHMGKEDQETLDRIRTLLMHETDENWRHELLLRQLRIESTLRERAEAEAETGTKSPTPYE